MLRQITLYLRIPGANRKQAKPFQARCIACQISRKPIAAVPVVATPTNGTPHPSLRCHRLQQQIAMPEQTDFPRIDAALIKRAETVIKLATERACTIATAESCTAGLLAAVLAEPPGAGTQLQGGFVTYTKDQKAIALGISRDLLDRESAVSKAVAIAMAEGAIARSIADLSVSITGVAGPEPDEDGNPVGLVHLAAARRNGPTLHEEHHFADRGRGSVLYQTVMTALDLLERCAIAEQDRAGAGTADPRQIRAQSSRLSGR